MNYNQWLWKIEIDIIKNFPTKKVDQYNSCWGKRGFILIWNFKTIIAYAIITL